MDIQGTSSKRFDRDFKEGSKLEQQNYLTQ